MKLKGIGYRGGAFDNKNSKNKKYDHKKNGKKVTKDEKKNKDKYKYDSKSFPQNKKSKDSKVTKGAKDAKTNPTKKPWSFRDMLMKTSTLRRSDRLSTKKD